MGKIIFPVVRLNAFPASFNFAKSKCYKMPVSKVYQQPFLFQIFSAALLETAEELQNSKEQKSCW